MTKKDYIAIARALAETKPAADAPCASQWLLDVVAMADVLAADNGRFDRSRFLRACDGH